MCLALLEHPAAPKSHWIFNQGQSLGPSRTPNWTNPRGHSGWYFFPRAIRSPCPVLPYPLAQIKPGTPVWDCARIELARFFESALAGGGLARAMRVSSQRVASWPT
jgi:hypothetical protein